MLEPRLLTELAHPGWYDELSDPPPLLAYDLRGCDLLELVQSSVNLHNQPVPTLALIDAGLGGGETQQAGRERSRSRDGATGGQEGPYGKIQQSVNDLFRGFDLLVEDEQALQQIQDAVIANPMASAVCCQVSRMTQKLSIADALVVESLAYATLQSGEEHRHWLASHHSAKLHGSNQPRSESTRPESSSRRLQDSDDPGLQVGEVNLNGFADGASDTKTTTSNFQDSDDPGLQVGEVNLNGFADGASEAKAASSKLQVKGDPVLLAREGDLLGITLNSPGNRNALSVAMRDSLTSAFRLAALDETISQVFLDANGPAFCAGGDLSEFGTAKDMSQAHHVRLRRMPAGALAEIASKVQCRVHGACIGAGIELPAFAAENIAAPDSCFRLPEVQMGLIPGAGGCVSIPRRIGRQMFNALAITGQEIDAEEALALGLIDQIKGR